MTVSIFTPTNDSSYLHKVYESIKDQPFDEWIILYNNGGTPITFPPNETRVKTFIIPSVPEWVGTLKAMTCEKATGDILVELDHDDLLTSDCISEVKKAFEDPEVGFVYSNTIHAMGDLSSAQRFSELFGWSYNNANFLGHSLDEHISFPPVPESISKIWFAPNHVRAFRKSVYDQVGGFNKDMRVLDDLDLMCRMFKVTKFHHINKGLYVYRIHGKNTWQKYNKEIQDNVYRIYDQYIEELIDRHIENQGLRKVELGGRMNAKAGYETLDLKDADIICDLNEDWPLPDSSVGVIRSFDTFEHLVDPIHTMKEVQRVLAPGGWLICQVPSTDGRGAFQDPTHKSFWNENSFLYYTNSKWAKYIDTPVRFQASRLYTTAQNNEKVCWVRAHLINLKDGYRPSGLIEI